MDTNKKTDRFLCPEGSPSGLLPSYCCFVATLRCMFRCRMCRIWREETSFLDELTVIQWSRVVESLRNFYNPQHDIIFSGGEPFLKQDILDMAYVTSRRGYKVSIDTNAYLIDRDLAKRISDAGVWRVCISLDSLKEEVYDRLRGVQGAFMRVMRGIDYLRRYAPGVGINIQTVIMKQNITELLPLTEWVRRDDRIDYIYFQAIVCPFGSGQDESWRKSEEYGVLWPDDSRESERNIQAVLAAKASNAKIANSVEQLRAYRAYFTDPREGVPRLPCTIGDRDLNINPSGEVYLCFVKESLGNVREESIEKMWFSQKAHCVRQNIRECREFCHFRFNCSFDGDSERNA